MNYFFKELFLIFAHFVFDISIVVIKIIKNMRGNLTNQIKDFLHSIRHTVSLHATECNIANILRVFKGEILQKQPPKVFCKKRCSEKFCKMHRKTKSLCRRCFPVNFAKFLRTPFLQNTSGRLLLILGTSKLFTSIAPENCVITNLSLLVIVAYGIL